MPMLSIQCAVCGKKEKTKELYKENVGSSKITNKTFSARRTPDRLHYRFVRCATCGLVFSNPIFPQNKIVNLYEKSTFDYSLESAYLKKTYGSYLKKLLTNNKNSKLLDIGCGNGFFLEEAKEMGVTSVFGIEPGRSSVEQAPKWLQKSIKVDILKKGIFPDHSFDIICCFHTLDHIVDPNAFLKNTYAILKKGGKALFIVHDTDGLSVKLFGEKSPIFDIEHIFLFNRKNLAMLFEKNNFIVQETFPVNNTYPISYWIRMAPLPNIFKNLSKPFFNIPISLNAGNIGIIVSK
jgi:ubiquinone/menaquinone biosynthesis C-methylase UbiE